MDQVVARLLQIDQTAAQMVNDARTELEQTKAAMESEKESFKRSYLEKAKHRISLLEKEGDAQVQEASSRLDQHNQKQLQKMQKKYDENHKKWEEEIFHRCLQ